MAKEAPIGGKVRKVRKTKVLDVFKTMSKEGNDTVCQLKEAKDLKCEFFKKFLALEFQKNENRKKSHQ